MPHARIDPVAGIFSCPRLQDAARFWNARIVSVAWSSTALGFLELHEKLKVMNSFPDKDAHDFLPRCQS